MKSGVRLLALFILLRGSDSTLLKLLQRADGMGEATRASMTDLQVFVAIAPGFIQTSPAGEIGFFVHTEEVVDS